MSSPASSRLFQASQCVRTVRAHLAPRPADHVFAHRTPNKAVSARFTLRVLVPDSEYARDQRLNPGLAGLGPDLARHSGAARQRSAAPFLGAAIDSHSGAKHADLRWAEVAEHLTLARLVPAARRLTPRPLVPLAPQCSRQLPLQQLLDEPAHRRPWWLRSAVTP